MLDMFGNVFGRSKKQTTSSSNVNNGSNKEPIDGFVVVGHQTNDTSEEHSLYPRVTTMLTQEMIVNSGQPSSAVSHASRVSPTVQRTTSQSYSTPIDNIPFTTCGSGGQELVDNNSRSIERCSQTIDRIQNFLSTGSQSEYTFHLENTILSESLLSK